MSERELYGPPPKTIGYGTSPAERRLPTERELYGHGRPEQHAQPAPTRGTAYQPVLHGQQGDQEVVALRVPPHLVERWLVVRQRLTALRRARPQMTDDEYAAFAHVRSAVESAVVSAWTCEIERQEKRLGLRDDDSDDSGDNGDTSVAQEALPPD